jgi:hypothetical protein
MKDKRKTKRRFLLYYMRVYDNRTHQQIGNLVDITPDGVMLISATPIPEKQVLPLRLELSSEVADKPFMDFIALSKWCRPDVDPNQYNIGFEITEIAKDDEKIIQKIITEFGFRDNRIIK